MPRMRQCLNVGLVFLIILIIFVSFYFPRASHSREPLKPPSPLNQLERKKTLAEITGIAIRKDGGEWHGYDVICNNTNVTFPVTNLLTPSGTSPIYLYDPDHDIRVSMSLLDTGTWQSNVVLELRDLMDQHSKMVFLDIGAGIGVFSLAMAQMHRFVIAVEPSPENARRLCEGIIQGRFQRKVSIINNALSDTVKMMELDVWDDERSNVRVRDVTKSSSNPKVEAIRLDDIVNRFPFSPTAIRIDVGENVVNVLRGVGSFFDATYVWGMILYWNDVLQSPPEDVQYVLSFMDRYNMVPYRKATGKTPLVRANYKLWPAVVIFRNIKRPDDLS